MSLTPLKSEMRLLFKHTRFLSIILIVQFVSCFSFLALLIQATFSAQQMNNEQISNPQTIYSVNQSLDDLDFYRFFGNENYQYEQLFTFFQRLHSDERFTYAICSPVQVRFEGSLLPDECYSEPLDSGYDFVFCNAVSSNYFRFFNADFLDGEAWSERNNVETETIPIVLGYYYHSIFSVGDVINGNLDESNVNYKVVGMLPENTLFDVGSSYYSADNFSFIPFSIPEYVVNPSSSVKLHLLDAFNGVMNTSLDREEFYSVLNNLATETGAPFGTNGINITDYTNDSIEEYIAISGAVLKQYYILCFVCSIFVLISLTMAINGMLMETRRIQGILLLLGASIRDIAKCVIAFVFIEALIGDALFILASAIMNINLLSILGAQLLVAIIALLSCVFPIKSLLREDTFELIGGKE